MLSNKKIVVAISGGIAAYKAIDLISQLRKQGADVRVILTENGARFACELTLEVISQNKVYSSLWDGKAAIPHIELADWADMIVVAPATANVITKAAHGFGDDLLSTTILAAHTPILFVPAMNVNMYEKQVIQENIKILKRRGYWFVEPEKGHLACGYEGKGRYPDNKEIIYYIKTSFQHKHSWHDKKILVTAGSCRENIDAMRFITNHSSGKMGIALARAAHILGAEVTLIAGNVTEPIPEYLRTIRAYTAEEMLIACEREFPQNSVLLMSAAVSDYKPKEAYRHKIKKAGDINLELVRTTDILSKLAETRKKGQFICGFAAESEDIAEKGKEKMIRKKLDFIVANDLRVAGADITSCTFISAENQIELLGDKFEVSLQILDFINSQIN